MMVSLGTRVDQERQKDFGEVERERVLLSTYVATGAAYKGLDSSSLSDDEIRYLDERLRIISGLYGLIRPLDLIKPYRLDSKIFKDTVDR